MHCIKSYALLGKTMSYFLTNLSNKPMWGDESNASGMYIRDGRVTGTVMSGVLVCSVAATGACTRTVPSKNKRTTVRRL